MSRTVIRPGTRRVADRPQREGPPETEKENEWPVRHEPLSRGAPYGGPSEAVPAESQSFQEGDEQRPRERRREEDGPDPGRSITTARAPGEQQRGSEQKRIDPGERRQNPPAQDRDDCN